MTATLDELEQRIAILEQAGGSDTLQPNVLTDIGGRIGAQFTGQVNALGLVLPAGSNSPPNPISDVQWDRADGANIADVYGYELSGIDLLVAEANATLGNGAQAVLRARDALGAEQARVTAIFGSPSGVGVIAGPKSATVIDGNGGSSFPQLAAPAKSTSGSQVVTFSAGTQANMLTISVPGATGHCFAVAAADLTGVTPCICTVHDNGNGTVGIRTFTVNLSSVSGTTTVNFLAWGT